MSTAREIIDYGHNAFGMDSEHFAAIMAVHGAVHEAKHTGTKYTWFGPGYISNMYFKMLANKPMYMMPNRGGDLSFVECFEGKPQQSSGIPNFNVAVGDTEGNPIPYIGW